MAGNRRDWRLVGDRIGGCCRRPAKHVPVPCLAGFPIPAHVHPVMQIVCLDLEGVLVPEIWIEFAERTGIPELRRTTRDEPDYDKLMRGRLGILRQHGLGLADIQDVIAAMGPMAGARDFLDALRDAYQVMILSDTFYEFARPLMRQLGRPTLFCHSLVADADGMLVDYRLRMPDQKREAVKRFRGSTSRSSPPATPTTTPRCSPRPHAASCSIRPRTSSREFPQFPVTWNYDELRREIDQAFLGLRPPT